MTNEFGAILGSAVSLNYDQQVNDLFRYDQMRKQTQALNESKAKLFADDLEFQNAMNEYDAPRVKEFAANQIRRIGEFVKNNPDYATDVGKMGQLKVMKNELKNNTPLLRGLAVDKAYKEYLTDRQEALKNPNSWNMKALDAEGQKFNNYFKTGNANGLVGLETEGEQPVVYTRPAAFRDLSKTGVELGNNFADVKPIPLKNGRNGAWETIPNEATLDKDAQAFYLENKDQFDQQHPANPIQAAKDFIRSGIKKQFNYGDNHYAESLELLKRQHAMSLEKLAAKDTGKDKGKIDYYVQTLVSPRKTAENPTRLAQTIGTKIPHKIVNDDASITIDNTGGDFFFNGDITDRGYREDGKYNRDGIKVASGYVLKPIKFAADNGIISDPSGLSGTPELEGEGYGDYQIDPTWSKKASIIDVPTAGGKTVKMVKLNVDAEIDMNNPGYQGKYNSLVSTAKQRADYDQNRINAALGNEGQPEQSGQANIPTGTKKDFINAGWNDAQIQRGIKEGKIKVN